MSGTVVPTPVSRIHIPNHPTYQPASSPIHHSTITLFPPQRLDGVQLRRLGGRVVPEKDTDGG